jgi:hypothetical protein
MAAAGLKPGLYMFRKKRILELLERRVLHAQGFSGQPIWLPFLFWSFAPGRRTKS